MREITSTTRRQFLRAAFGIAAAASCAPFRGFGLPDHFFSALPGPLALDGPIPKQREAEIELESSDAKLVDGFHWAKAQAMDYARTDGKIGPWYEAALPGRDAFCMRDVSHQSTGAQFLGLGPRTLNMLRSFAANVSASKKWCTWWEITRDDLPAPVDYNSDNDFWYDLPSSFDVLDACYRQWLWTRDSNYLDEQFLNYYRHTVTDYVNAWDHDRNGLLEHLPSDGHMGIATYDEDLQDEILVGADLLAAQYAAFRDYAAIERFRGDSDAAAHFNRKADLLQSLYNSHWWDAKRRRYFGALGENGKFADDLKESNGRCTLELPLYYGLIEEGFKTEAVLDELENRLKLDQTALHGIVGGVEGRTYLPDIFYKYGRSRAGYRALMAMIDPGLKRREYPEVSYTVIGNLGTGLMGIRPLAPAQTIETFPQLTTETSWAALHQVPVGRNVVSVKQVKNNETALTNEKGPVLAWRAAFPGKFRALFSNGKEIPASHAVRSSGTAETYSMVRVASGEMRVVRVASG